MGDDHSDVRAAGRRILVISNETAEGTALHEAIRFRAHNVGGEVLVVAPALSTPVRRLMGDTDRARRAAQRRLEGCLRRLGAAGVRARGRVGDRDPLQAIDDALQVFAADEIIIATHPQGRSQWLASDLVARARLRFDIPVLHIVVDLVAQAEHVEAERGVRVQSPPPTLSVS